MVVKKIVLKRKKAQVFKIQTIQKLLRIIIQYCFYAPNTGCFASTISGAGTKREREI